MFGCVEMGGMYEVEKFCVSMSDGGTKFAVEFFLCALTSLELGEVIFFNCSLMREIVLPPSRLFFFVDDFYEEVGS